MRQLMLYKSKLFSDSEPEVLFYASYIMAVFGLGQDVS